MNGPSVTAVKTLFAESRNLCFFPRCEEILTNPAWRQVNAEVAHIKGEQPGSARYDSDQDDDHRQSYENLMLLCPKHHKLVDRLEPDRFSVDDLETMKANHVTHRSEGAWCAPEKVEEFARLAVADAIRMALAQPLEQATPQSDESEIDPRPPVRPNPIRPNVAVQAAANRARGRR